jgi:hypothetical protein
MHATCPAHFILLNLLCLSTNCEAPHCAFLHSIVTSSLFGPNILLRTLFSNALVYALPLMWETEFHTHTKNWQNYGFVYFNLWIPRQQVGRQRTLNLMIVSTAQEASSLASRPPSPTFSKWSGSKPFTRIEWQLVWPGIWTHCLSRAGKTHELRMYSATMWCHSYHLCWQYWW